MAAETKSAYLEQRLDDLTIVSKEKKAHIQVDNNISKQDEASLKKWGFQVKDLYRLALKFYKEQEGKAVHLSYQDKLRLVAFTQQVCHGPFNSDTMPPLGVLDVIGRDRRLAWQALGVLPEKEAMLEFAMLLDQLCPLFSSFVEAHKCDLAEKERKSLSIESSCSQDSRCRLEQEKMKQEEEEREEIEKETRRQLEEEQARQEAQRRQIQDALNQQTFPQFKTYAEQQYPGNPEQQAVLVRQLQEQHYHQYMQQLLQSPVNPHTGSAEMSHSLSAEAGPEQTQLLNNGGGPRDPEDIAEDSDADAYDGDLPPIAAASMWTRNNIREFKESIRQEGGESIIKVGHGETVTVRVPTHADGTCLFWEFATDSYDIGFGVFFEWTRPESTQVSVHISESEEDEEEEDDDDDEALGDDLEGGVRGLSGNMMLSSASNRPPLSMVVPVYRRDCQEEVYAGSHTYPGSGVYLLKFDNSYSLWRSKTLFYRVYYTR